MIGWRRRAKAARENTVSPERLYELVSQTLMENFGPLGSFAITRRSAADTDDIFHTALARSVARDIVANLAEHGITVRSTLGQSEATPATAASARLAPVERVFVPRDLARAVASATTLPTAPVTVVPITVVPAAASAGAASVPAMPYIAAPIGTAPAPIGTAPVLDGPDPRDDDALRALVAHHAEVTEAAARNHNQVRWVI